MIKVTYTWQMGKRILVIASGFLGYLFLEGFIRLIIMFYHRDEFHFYGISHLPDNSWAIVILISILIVTWLCAMMILSVLRNQPAINTIIFFVILMLWRSIEIFNSYQSEPMWYFIAVAICHLAGSFLAYQLYFKQHEISLKS